MNRRIVVAGLTVALLLGTELALQRAGLRVNLTASEPRGVYLTTHRPWQRGSFVIFWLPPQLSTIALQSGYALAGKHAGAAMEGLKRVAALLGDTVAVEPKGVIVNGVLWPDSKPLTHDSRGHQIRHYPFGVYRVRRGEVWLLSNSPRGWDSRYFGPLPLANVVASAEPLLTFK
jgi:conjugative transfer signal peptidase TraF